MSFFSVWRPERRLSRLPDSVARTRKKNAESTTPASASCVPISPAPEPAGMVTSHGRPLHAAERLKEQERADDEERQDGDREQRDEPAARRDPAPARGARRRVAGRGHDRAHRAAHAADADRPLGLVVERAGGRGGRRRRVGLDAADGAAGRGGSRPGRTGLRPGPGADPRACGARRRRCAPASARATSAAGLGARVGRRNGIGSACGGSGGVVSGVSGGAGAGRSREGGLRSRLRRRLSGPARLALQAGALALGGAALRPCVGVVSA